MNSIFFSNCFVLFPEIFLACSIFVLLVLFTYFKFTYRTKSNYGDLVLNQFGFSIGVFSLFIYVSLCLIQLVFSDFNSSYNVFGSVLQANSFSFLTKTILGLVIFIISSSYFRSYKGFLTFGYEIIILILSMLLGMVICLEANDIIAFYTGLELQSFCFFILLGIGSFTKLDAIKSCITYFLSVIFSSILFLSGLVYIYWRFGSLRIPDLALLVYSTNISGGFTIIDFLFFVILLTGLLVKVGLFPVHFWIPKVYTDSPILPVSLIATASKIFGFFILLRFFIVFSPSTGIFLFIELFSIFAILVGVFGALNQSNFRSLIGYSAIAHAGYIFIIVSTNVPGSYIYGFFYLVTYTFNLLPIFIFLFCVYWSKDSPNSKEFTSISDFQNVKLNTWVQVSIFLSFSTFFFSFIGIPPFSGFFAKFVVIKYLVSSLHLFSALVVGVASLISAIYYLRVVKDLFFGPRTRNLDEGWEIPRYASILIIALGLINICFIFIAPQFLSIISSLIV